ncbi:hypothetical protein OQJ13_01810 [Legionella sp. PATHC035]|uniref:hypothetical protein n=1 Tax=Legionella sp. PATHC035 TaxID=2992040 RepID=UPI00224344CE|nr:hypothetical protein [Legionella sp. PATHC035]MCW8407710.1 hypothetical protein [Legionella sp. PATHC035]
MRHEVKANSPIKTIYIHSSSYQKNIFSGLASIQIEFNSDGLQNMMELLDLLNDNQFEFHRNRADGLSIIRSYKREEIRNIMDFLLNKGLIGNSDRADLEDVVRFEEKSKITYDLNRDMANSEQKNIIESLCVKQIGALMKIISNEEDLGILLKLLECDYFRIPGKAGKDKIFLDFKDWLAQSNKYTEKEINDLHESYLHLQKIYRGMANLEDTLLKAGQFLPNLATQQKIIIDMLTTITQTHLYAIELFSGMYI